MISATHLHAILIHFPIALLIIGYFSEIIGLINKKLFFKNVSFYLLIIGVLGVVVAYISGNYADDILEMDTLKVPLELHEQAALIVLILSITLILFKAFISVAKLDSTFYSWIGIILFTALIIAITVTGYLGGQLVYKYGAGVELALLNF